MKKLSALRIYFFLALVSLFGTSSLQASSGDSGDKDASNKSTRWGMKKEDVKKVAAGALIEETETILLYDNFRISNLNCRVGYVFHKDKLIKRSYLFMKNYSHAAYYLADTRNLKKALDELHGKARTKYDWKAEPYPLNENNLSEAVLKGDLELTTVWDLRHTLIVLNLKGDNGKMIMTLNYSGN